MHLLTYLEEHNLSVQEFASKCSLTRNAIYDLIKRKAPPRKSTVALIAHATDGKVTLEDLIYLRKKLKPKKLDAKTTKV
jgi:predicted DNA-binding protein YlxM (UPF0122 family)